jgi:hypothetical protein
VNDHVTSHRQGSNAKALRARMYAMDGRDRRSAHGSVRSSLAKKRLVDPSAGIIWVSRWRVNWIAHRPAGPVVEHRDESSSGAIDQ